VYTVTDVDGQFPINTPLVMSPGGLIVAGHLSLYAPKDTTTQHQHRRNVIRWRTSQPTAKVFKLRSSLDRSLAIQPGAVLRALFLASTVSALHRNAHIWNVTFFFWVTVYSPSMQATKNVANMWQCPGVEPGRDSIAVHVSANCAIWTGVPHGPALVVLYNEECQMT